MGAATMRAIVCWWKQDAARRWILRRLACGGVRVERRMPRRLWRRDWRHGCRRRVRLRRKVRSVRCVAMRVILARVDVTMSMVTG